MAGGSIIPSFEDEASGWTGTYTWQIRNWTGLTERRIHSPEFEVGGYTWRLLVYPRGNDRDLTSGFISVYLEFREGQHTSPHMCPDVKLELIAMNTVCPEKSRRLKFSQTFTPDSKGYGFSKFLRIQRAHDSEVGFLENDALTLRVNIRVVIDGILGMTSKFETGFVGIKNLGKTSLLTSFLLCLFHIKAFKKAVFQMKTPASDEPQRSLALALQHLFYKLRYWNTSAKIKDLLKAFDFDLNDACLQHDVHKIQRILFNKLARDFRASSVMDCIFELFTGQHSTYIESVCLQDAPTFKQPYMEISLDIWDCQDIYASLEKLCQIQRLGDGDPCHWITREFGESKHYMLFDSFPTVLLFHLKRGQYNPDREVIIRINSNFEFYDELDLDYNDRVLQSSNADRTMENKYRLHSVIVHKSGIKEGRYFAFVRCQEKWYKFEDEVVKEVSAEEAINAQFGHQNDDASANFSKGFKTVNKSAAVMLVYIRKCEWERVMCESGKQHLPKLNRERFERELITKQQQLKEKEAHFYMNIKLATEFHFAEQMDKSYHLGLAAFDKVKNYRIYKNTSFKDFKETVSKAFGIPIHLQRFWQCTSQANNSMRLSKPIIEEPHNLKTVFDLRHFRDKTSPLDQEKTALMTIKLFLESPEKTVPNKDVYRNNLCPIGKNEWLIFVKYYDPGSSKLSYLGHVFVKKHLKIRVLLEKAKTLARLSPGDDIIGVKEVEHPSTIICLDLDPESTLQRMQLIQGNIIIIQKVAENTYHKYPPIRSFLEFLQNSMIVNFRSVKKPADEGIKVRLLKTTTYERLITKLSKHLQVDDPRRIRLMQCDMSTCLPHRTPIECNEIGSEEQMMLHGSQHNNILYYAILDRKLGCLESLCCLTIGFHNSKGVLQSRHYLTLSKNDTVSDLVKALKAELGEEYNDCDMRIMTTLFSKVFKVFNSEHPLKSMFEDYSIVRAEVIPEDQKQLKSDEYLVLFCHCKQNDNRLTAFGDPLWIKVKKDETVREVKVRVQKTLEISNEKFSQWRIAYHAHPPHPVVYLSDEDKILEESSKITRSRKTNKKFLGNENTFIALVHKDKRANH